MEMLTTMITPYTKDGAVDYKTAEKYVDWYFENGLDGIFAVCQSSEIFYLSLEEKVKLNTVVYNRAKELEKKSGKPFVVVSSGHTSYTIEDQAKELNAIWESGTDCLILITNRLDPHNDGDDVFIENTKKLICLLPKDVKLGLYECPYPYKRLVTPKILDFCLSTGKFYYMKDTCCDQDLIAERTKQLRGSSFKLLNANGQTLLHSMRNGAYGYCGVMCNFHPKLYSWLCENYKTQPEKADYVHSIMGTFAFVEALSYPLSAKYHMNLCGIPTETITRVPNPRKVDEYIKLCMKNMKLATDTLEKELGI